MNIQTSNPYEMDDPNIDAEDYECTDENPCGECDWCEGDIEPDFNDDFPMSLEYNDDDPRDYDISYGAYDEY